MELFQPAVCADHLRQLIAMHLEQTSSIAPVEYVEVTVTRPVRVAQRQRSLWGDGAALAGTSLAALIDRLAARLGAAHVVRPRRQAEYQPESAWRSVPLVGPAPGAAARTEPRRVLAEPGASGFERPLELLSPPEPLEAIAVAGAGPPGAIQTPHRRRTVRRTWGPERIETGWWRGPLVRRDYWRIEIDSGQWWWVFRDLDDGRWYLHGVFE
jgi:protein ImuB